MKKTVLLSIVLGISFSLFAQVNMSQDSIQPTTQLQQNAYQTFLSNKDAKKVTLGAYGEVHYNEPDGATKGLADVHRMVFLFGYNFTEKVQFFTEIEYEHVQELFVEQAFINYNVSNNFSVRAGLMLVPMGIINEFHESPTFFGVERPDVDKYIVPTTWREIGFGVSGQFGDMPLRYQAYIFNGFNSDGLRGIDGLRRGRQKGAEATVSSPNFSAKLDYYGVRGLRLGLSGYFGDTQTDEEDEDIPGTTVGVSMIGFDARYNYKRLKAAGQYIVGSISDTEAYNIANGSDLGSKLEGWYIVAGYNVLPTRMKEQLSPFVRYEQYDTHADTDGGLTRNDAYNRNTWTLGLNYQVSPGAAFKIDYQINDDKTNVDLDNVFNAGIAIWF